MKEEEMGAEKACGNVLFWGEMKKIKWRSVVCVSWGMRGRGGEMKKRGERIGRLATGQPYVGLYGGRLEEKRKKKWERRK